MGTVLTSTGYAVQAEWKALEARFTYLSTAAYAALTVGVPGEIYVDNDTGGQPQKRWDPVLLSFTAIGAGGSFAALTGAPTSNTLLAADLATKVSSAATLTTALSGATAPELVNVRQALGVPAARLPQAISGTQDLTSANANTRLTYNGAAGTLTAALDATTGCTSDEYWLIETSPSSAGFPTVTNGTDITVGGPNVTVMISRRGADDYTIRLTSGVINVTGTVRPEFSSAAVPNAAAGTLQVNFSGPIDAVQGIPSTAFYHTNSGAAQTITAVNSIIGSQVILALSRLTLAADVVKVGMNAQGTNPLQNASGDLAIAFGLKAVTNGVSAGGVLLRFTGAGTLPPVETQPGGANTPYKYSTQAVSSSYGTCFGGSPTVSMPASNASAVSWRATYKPDTASTVTPSGFGLHTSATPVHSTSWIYGIHAINAVGGNYKVWISGVSSTANGTATASASGDIHRLSRAGGSSTIIAEIARAATPTTFILLHTFAATTVAQLFPQFSLGDTQNNAASNAYEEIQHVGMT